MKNALKLMFAIIISMFLVTGCRYYSNDDVITGEWKINDNSSERYYKFENDKFWWYKTYTDLNDNYWYGSMKILRGQEALDFAGIDDDEFKQEYYKNGIKKQDYYVLVLTPEKLISDGKDQSSAIPQNSSWTLFWIVNNNNSKNITASIIYMSDYSTTSYVKVK